MTDATEGSVAVGALSPYNVLDLSTERAWMTGKMLADLGATVTKVEPPGGDPGRLHGPYADDESSPENSLAWWAFNLGKRSITLDLGSADGRELFLRLVADADAVIESFDPGQMERWGLGYGDLAAVNPAVVLTRVSPFGQHGPFSRFAATDLVMSAISGPLHYAGDVDRPPVRISQPQYFLHGAVEAAVHTIAALYHAGATGQGQTIDVSVQLASVRTLMNAAAFPHVDPSASAMRTTTGAAPSGPGAFKSVFSASDGYILATVATPIGGGLRGYIQWLKDEDELPDDLAELSDEDLLPTAVPSMAEEKCARITDVLDKFFAARPRGDLVEQAMKYRLMLVAINNAEAVNADEHLAARGYFTEVRHRDRAQPVRYPHKWANYSGTPIAGASPPPRIGEHNLEVWAQEVGLTHDEIRLLQDGGTI